MLRGAGDDALSAVPANVRPSIQFTFAFIVAALVLSNCIPTGIPLLSTVTGIPMVLVVAQAYLGRTTPRLPAFLGGRALQRHVAATPPPDRSSTRPKADGGPTGAPGAPGSPAGPAGAPGTPGAGAPGALPAGAPASATIAAAPAMPAKLPPARMAGPNPCAATASNETPRRPARS